MHPQGRPLIQVTPSPYKTLSQVQQFPETRIDQTVHAIRGRIDKVSSPYIRFAPGLSLRYQHSVIPQSAAFTDGDSRLVLYPPDNPMSNDFAPYTLAYSGYALQPGAQSVLAVMQNGGSAIACVRASGIEDATLVIENPVLGNMISKHYDHTVISRPMRSYLATTDRHFDIIQVEHWDTSIPGSGALNQSHLFTREAFIQYLDHLTGSGVIIVSRRLLLPPSDSMRLWSAAYEGLRTAGIADPEKHLAVLRNWDTFVLLVSRQPLVNASILKKFAAEHNFDLVFLADLPASQANRFNQFDVPYHFNQLQQLAAAYRQNKENDFFRAYLLDVRPQSDNRPFPGRYLKWTKVKTLYRTLGSRLYTLLLSGEIVVMVVFIEALAVSAMVLFLPLLYMRRHVLKPSLQQALFFIGIGAGFMFVELFFIKKLMLIWSDPVISFSVVVTGVLVFSSLGGAWAQKKEKSVLNGSLVILIMALLMIFFALDRLVHLVLGWAPVWKYALVLLALGPIGFLMGLPFTIGMRNILFSDAQRAWAWSANGCASVLASIAAAQIALMFGVRFILGSAVVSYLLVMLSWQYLKRL
jgi:hypothetical protein